MLNCPICDSLTYFLAVKKDRFGQMYKYIKCKKCNFLFDEDLVLNKRKLENKTGNIYQKDYQDIDSGWKVRGEKVSKLINRILKIYKFIRIKKELSILDYGGGKGYITSKINNDFNVFYYDKYEKPVYAGNYKILDAPFKNDVVYAVEVVEHIIDIKKWDLLAHLSSNALLFTTELSDGISDEELGNWWYLNPDAGHISIYSSESLYLLAKKYGFAYFFFPSKSFHIFLKSPLLSRFNFIKLEYPFYNFFRKIKHILEIL